MNEERSNITTILNLKRSRICPGVQIKIVRKLV